jgi:nitrate/TMAO reductase-like tetraheme cytochrome c subunit
MSKVRVPKGWEKKTASELIEIREVLNDLIFKIQFKEKLNEDRDREEMHKMRDHKDLDKLFDLLGDD